MFETLSIPLARDGWSWLARRLSLLARLPRLRAERRALARLNASLLRDIGLTPEEARAEASRKPWDVPAHWLR